MINVEVNKNNNENTTSLIRRFTKRVQNSGVLPRIRSVRYWARAESACTKKKRALRKLSRKKNYEELYKQGKIAEQTKKRGRFYRR